MWVPPLPVSAREVHRVVPQGCDPVDPTAPVYLLKTPTLLDKAKLDRSVTAHGARFVSFQELMVGLRQAATALLDEGPLTALLPTLDEFERMVTQPPEAAATVTEAASDATTDDAAVPDPAAEAALSAELSRRAEVSAQVAAFEAQAQTAVPAYAQLLADREFWWTIARTEAARHLLIGWEHVEVPFTRGRDGVLSIDALSALDPAHVFEVGLKARELLTVSPRQRGN